MPINYRCPGCSRWLSISRKKIGQMVGCPACGAERRIPERDDERAGTARSPESAYINAPSALSGIDPGEAGEEIEFAEAEEDSNPSPPPMVPAPPIATSVEPFEFAAWDETSRSSGRQSVVRADAGQPAAPAEGAVPISPGGESGHAAVSEGSAAAHEEDDEPIGMFSRRRGEFEDMDLTPMVDMMILLLMFFMVTTSKELQKSLEMPAPGSDNGGAMQSMFTPEQLEETTIRVRIDDKNVVYIEDEAVASHRQILEKIKVQMRDSQRYELTLSADPAAFHETVVAVVDAAQAAGAQKIRMAGGGGE